MDKEKMLGIIDRFRDVRIAVVGDLMLDVYLWGRATRISPEAPVPIVRIGRESSCLGGAANAMRNLVTLGGRAAAFGMIGDDADGREIRAQLNNYGIDSSTVETDVNRRTTKKQRVIAGMQQLLRIDYEDTDPAPEALAARITANVLALIENRAIDAIIFEDYAKGMLSSAMLEQIVPAANAKNIITALDPKPGTMYPVKGLTVIKPNRREAIAMANLPGVSQVNTNGNLDLVADKIREEWAPKFLLVSLAAEGMALFDAAGKSLIPTRAREVYDVSGAGDTVVAAFTLALAAGATPREAAEIGNYAAGIVVGKVGTVTVSAEELKAEIGNL